MPERTLGQHPRNGELGAQRIETRAGARSAGTFFWKPVRPAAAEAGNVVCSPSAATSHELCPAAGASFEASDVELRSASSETRNELCAAAASAPPFVRTSAASTFYQTRPASFRAFTRSFRTLHRNV